MRKYIINLAVALGFVLTAQGQTLQTNYVKTTAYKVATQDGVNTTPVTGTTTRPLTNDERIEQISYFDGLGRPVQIIQARAGGARENIIQHKEYDGYGREVRQYLPYVTPTEVTFQTLHKVSESTIVNGINNYYQSTYPSDFSAGILNPYSEVLFEDSPLNRVFKQAAPGKDWSMGNGHEVKMDYRANSASDGVRMFGVAFNDVNNPYEPTLVYEGNYLNGTLYKSIVKDENWAPIAGSVNLDHTVEEFKDKQGRVVLKRTYDANQRHDTYYVYDDYGNLTYVIPPSGADQVVELNSLSNQSGTFNIPWTNLVNIDREFAEQHNERLSAYENDGILNILLENEYGGQGGMTITTHHDSQFITLNINLSVNDPIELLQGYIFDLNELGNFEDGEIGSLRGVDYEYNFLISNNQIFVTGSGNLTNLSATISNIAPISHSINYPWVTLVDADPTKVQYYMNGLTGVPNDQILTTYVPNPDNGTGGMNISVDDQDNVSVTINTNNDTGLPLRTGIIIPLGINRSLTDRMLGTVTGTDYSYTFELRGNALLVTGSGDVNNLTYNFTGIEPTISPSIDQPTLQGLCYIYEYDRRNRLVEKKIPGKDWEHIVYDMLDRPILTQDGNQRINSYGMPPNWNFTKYDKLGRVVYTGLYRSPLSRKQLQQTIDNTPAGSRILYERRSADPFTSGTNDVYYSNDVFPLKNDMAQADVLTVTYYDDTLTGIKTNNTTTHRYNIAGGIGDVVGYAQNGVNPTSNTKGMPTVSEVRVLGTTNWINSASYYDEKARPIHSKSVNDYLDTTDSGTMQLDFTGKVLETYSYHKKGALAPVTIKDQFTYDHMDRLLEHKQQLNNTAHWERIVKNSYDKMGQLDKKYVGGTPTMSTGLQQVDYEYNVRGWLTQINNLQQGLGTDLFAFKLDYNNSTAPNATPLYNGNIAATTWATGNDNLERRYTYQYDALNRIKEATYTGQVFANNTARGLNGQNEDYSIRNINYDKNGNILTLDRKGLYSNGSIANTYNEVDWVDKLVYSYAPKSNQLQNVIDLADSQSSGITNGGFKDVYTAGNKYIYGDLNGNMTRDHNKDMKYIRYNHLNLPTLVMFNSGDRIIYTYDAMGTKLAKQVMVGSASTFTYYAGAFIYEQDSTGENLAFFSQPEGYVEKNGSAFSYVYQHKDHLGNVRLSYKNTSTTGLALQMVEENNYYPFGLKHKGYNNTPIAGQRDHKYGYLNQEENNELGLGWLTFRYRNYMPEIGRFFGIDPVSSEYMSISTNQFAHNNPIWKIEIEGLEGASTTKKDANNNEAVRVQQNRTTPGFIPRPVVTKVVQETTAKVATEGAKNAAKETLGKRLATSGRVIGTTVVAFLWPQSLNAGEAEWIENERKKDVQLIPYSDNTNKGIDERFRVDDKKLKPQDDTDSPITRVNSSIENRYHHIFGKEEHNLDGFLEAFNGSQSAAFKAVEEAANQAFENGSLSYNSEGVLSSGNDGNILTVAGQQIQLMGGRVIAGRVYLSSFSQRDVN